MFSGEARLILFAPAPLQSCEDGRTEVAQEAFWRLFRIFVNMHARFIKAASRPLNAF